MVEIREFLGVKPVGEKCLSNGQRIEAKRLARLPDADPNGPEGDRIRTMCANAYLKKKYQEKRLHTDAIFGETDMASDKKKKKPEVNRKSPKAIHCH